MFETEFKFTLPKGYMDMNGNLHREGVMRLANAGDEIIPLKDPRVQQNPGYLTIIILSRVIKSLGTLPAVDTRVVEGLFTIDLAYLQENYGLRINTDAYIIAYDAYAENQLPNVKVVKRNR